MFPSCRHRPTINLLISAQFLKVSFTMLGPDFTCSWYLNIYLQKHKIYVYSHVFVCLKVFKGICVCHFVQIPWTEIHRLQKCWAYYLLVRFWVSKNLELHYRTLAPLSRTVIKLLFQAFPFQSTIPQILFYSLKISNVAIVKVLSESLRSLPVSQPHIVENVIPMELSFHQECYHI